MFSFDQQTTNHIIMKSLYTFLKVGILFPLVFISSNLSYSQWTTLHVFQDWAGNTGLTNHEYKASSAYDNTGALYVVGGTLSAGGEWDWLITKFDASTGYEIWSVA